MGLHRNRPRHNTRTLRGDRKYTKFQAAPSKRRRHPDVGQPEEPIGDLDLFPGQPDSGSLERPVQRNAANARERARMQVLSRAFCRLKTCLPWVPPDTKLSKLDTLRLAATYIAYLMKILREDEDIRVAPANANDCTPHPVALTWPFTINSRSTYADCTSVQESCRMVAEYSNDADYRNLVPCEYVALNQPNCHRGDTAARFIQQ